MSRRFDRFEQVLAALAADPSTEFGEPGAHVSTLGEIDGHYSTVRRVSVLTRGRTMRAYIKILKPRGGGDEDLAQADWFLQREYDATAAFYSAVKQDAAIGAVRPIAILPELRALVTEEVPGRPLGRILARTTTPTEDLLTVASRVGAWVRAYQRLGGGTRTVDISRLRVYVDDRLKLLHPRVISGSDREATLARLDALAIELGVSAVPAVPIHADLGPMNIIVGDDGRVTVLDFTMAKKGTAHHDLSHVYFHLELLAARRPRRRELVDAFERAMLAGYDSSLSPDDDPLFRMMLLQHAVCHVAFIAERRLPVVDAAYRWFLRRRWQTCERLLLPRRALRTA